MLNFFNASSLEVAALASEGALRLFRKKEGDI